MDSKERVCTDDVINLKTLWLGIRKYVIFMLAAGIVCGGLAFGYSKLFIAPEYSSTAKVAISSGSVKNDTKLTSDYLEIITLKSVLNEVIENLKLEITYDQLSDWLTIDNPDDTSIVNITVKCTEPETAKAVANELANVSSEYFAQLMKTETPEIIEEGEVSYKKVSPVCKKYALYGFLAGTFVAFAFFVIKYLFKDLTEDKVKK